MLILFLLVSAPDQGGRVVLNAGVPEAEFYLDANFVAVTDENGMLTMENFPAGSFSYSVVKRGYKTYKGSFSIRDGEAMQLSPIMEKIRETREPDTRASGSSRGSKPSSQKNGKSPGCREPLRRGAASSSPKHLRKCAYRRSNCRAGCNRRIAGAVTTLCYYRPFCNSRVRRRDLDLDTEADGCANAASGYRLRY